MPMLRKIEEPTLGNKQAWTTTFTKIWRKSTDFLQNYPNRADSGAMMKKRSSTQTSEHELEVQFSFFVGSIKKYLYLLKALLY